MAFKTLPVTKCNAMHCWRRSREAALDNGGNSAGGGGGGGGDNVPCVEPEIGVCD